MSGEDRRRFIPLCPDFVCPDFVIELRSESDPLRGLKDKMQEYMENGARMAWLIDPFEREVHIYRPGPPVEALDGPSQVSGDPMLPGFSLDLTEIWQ